MANTCRQALVVDDDAGVREVIADALGLEEIDVVSARGAVEAIGALDGGFRPSVILLDLLMPGVSGERLLPQLRQHPAARGVPVIAMSASPERLARIEGPDGRLAKPFDLDALLDMIGRLCARRVPPALVMGFPVLDAEHQTQLDLAQSLAEALRRGRDTQQAVSLLDQLIDCTKSHFSSEGELMRRHAYPDFVAHLGEHARHVSELERWRAADIARTSSTTAGEAIALRASIERHIVTMDRDLARYLTTRGAA